MLESIIRKFTELKYKKYTPDALEQLATDYATAGNEKKGIRIRENAIRIEKTTPHTYFNLAKTYYDMEKPDQSIRVLKEATRTGQENYKIYSFLAALLSDNDQPEETVETIMTIDKQYGIDQELLNIFLRNYLKPENEIWSPTGFPSSIEQSLTMDDAHLGISYLSTFKDKKNTKEVWGLLERAMDNGIYDQKNIFLAFTLIATAESPEIESIAKKVYAVACRENLTHPLIHLIMADRLKDDSYLFEAIRRNETSAMIYGTLGNNALNQDKPDEAQHYIEKALEYEQGELIGSILYINLSQVYSEKGQSEKAIKVLQDCIGRGIHNRIIYDELIGLCQKQDRFPEAFEAAYHAYKNQCPSALAATILTKQPERNKDFLNVAKLFQASYDYLKSKVIPNDTLRTDCEFFQFEYERYMVISQHLALAYYSCSKWELAKQYFEESYFAGEIQKGPLARLISIYLEESESAKLQNAVQYAIDNNLDAPLMYSILYKGAMIDKSKYHEALAHKTEDTGNRESALAMLVQESINEGTLFNKRPVDYLRELINTAKENNTLESRVRPFVESGGHVDLYTFDEHHLNIILKQSDSLQTLKDEEQNLNHIRTLLQGVARTPDSINCFEYYGKQYFAMTYEHAMSLTQLIKTGQIQEQEYRFALDTLATLHAKMPHNQSRYDFRGKVGTYIDNSGLQIDPSQMLRILPLLEESDHWGFSKDAFTDNWLFADDMELIVVDTENKGLVPYALDLASFLNFVPFYQYMEDRVYTAKQYVERINQLQDNPLDWDSFMQEFMVGTIYRSVEKAGYFRYLSRYEDMISAIGTGVVAIEYALDNNLLEKDPLEKIRPAFMQALP
ncbi:MAG: hypothetical protein R6V53_02675 [Candidatus Woesearchaeota archaeon]